MQWPDKPIPLGPLYYTFWPLVLVVCLLALIWLPQLRENRFAVTLVVIGAYVLFATYVWTR
jgi:hypothetical protein